MSSTQTQSRSLTSILVECGIVTDAQVEEALRRQRETGHFIGESLVELGFTSEENIGWALSKQLGIPYADIQPRALDPDLMKRFPEALLRRLQAIPLFGTTDEITVAMADPGDGEAVAELATAAAANVTLVIGGPGSIRRALDAYYGRHAPQDAEPAARAGAAAPGSLGAGLGSADAKRHDVVWDRAGTNFLLYHLYTARQRGASEVHFLPEEGRLGVHYRTDAGLQAQAPEPQETALFLRARLAALGVPDLAESSELLARGSAVIQVGSRAVAVGVSHCRTTAGIATVLRLAPHKAEPPDLSTLGLTPIGEAELREIAEGPEGVVIVYGPPRAGGSRLLSALVALASREGRRVLVMERSHVTPYPAGVTRVPFQRAHEAAAHWEEIVLGQGADVAALDDALEGESIARVMGPASVGRLLLARTDWLDGEALLACLASSRDGRAALGDRPFALIGLPAARFEGSAAWKGAEAAELRAGSVEVRLLSDEERSAIRRGRRG